MATGKPEAEWKLLGSGSASTAVWHRRWEAFKKVFIPVL
jgi:hypothetical protein